MLSSCRKYQAHRYHIIASISIQNHGRSLPGLGMPVSSVRPLLYFTFQFCSLSLPSPIGLYKLVVGPLVLLVVFYQPSSALTT